MKVLEGVLEVKYMVPPSRALRFVKLQLSINKFWQLQYIALPYTIRLALSLKVVLRTEMFPKLEYIELLTVPTNEALIICI